MDDRKNMLLEITDVVGLGNARALWASIVGPYRLAMADKKSVRLTPDNGVQLYKNIGAAEGYVLVGVARERMRATLNRRVLLEFLGVAVAGIWIIFQYGR